MPSKAFFSTPRVLGMCCCWLLTMHTAFAASVTYTVKSGDNPWVIAQKFHIAVEALLKANQLSEDSTLQIGQKLTIPVKATPAAKAKEAPLAPAVEFVDYAVIKGDTLSQIAEAHEVSLAELLQANGLSENSMLKVGLVLRIPQEIVTADAALDPNPDPTSHTLLKGESLWTIAKKYGVSVPDLATYNRISTGQVLMPGQVLLIPPANGEGIPPIDLLRDDIDPNAPIGGMEGILSLADAPDTALTVDGDGDVIYTSEPGDTVSHLAVKYRTTRQAIFEANHMESRDSLAPGQKLIIPRGSLESDTERVLAAKAGNRSDHGLPSRNSTLATRLVKFAVSHLGTPYVWAGTSLKRGVDCSGFVCAVYSNFGKDLPHNSKQQSKIGLSVSRKQLQPGDLIFFHTTRSGISHVGIYIGNNEFVHASTRSRQVRIDSLSDAYYTRAYVSARRIF